MQPKKLKTFILQIMALVCIVLDTADILNIFNVVPLAYLLLLTLFLVSSALEAVSSEHQELAQLSGEFAELRREFDKFRQENNAKPRDLVSATSPGRTRRWRFVVQIDLPLQSPVPRDKEIKAIQQATKDNGP